MLKYFNSNILYKTKNVYNKIKINNIILFSENQDNYKYFC